MFDESHKSKKPSGKEAWQVFDERLFCLFCMWHFMNDQIKL